MSNYHVFETCEKVLTLVFQEEYIEETESGEFIHFKEQRLTDWLPELLSHPRRNDETIPNFLSPNAPDNRLDILRGLA